MKLTCLIDIDDDELAAHLERLGFVRRPQPESGPRSPVRVTGPIMAGAPEPDDEPANVNAHNGPPSEPAISGKTYFDQLKGDKVTLRRVQDIGRSLGIGWQVMAWAPDQVARVKLQLEAKMPGDAMGAGRARRIRRGGRWRAGLSL